MIQSRRRIINTPVCTLCSIYIIIILYYPINQLLNFCCYKNLHKVGWTKETTILNEISKRLTGLAKVSVKSTTRGRVSTWRVRIALRIPVQLSSEAFTKFSAFRSYFYLQNTPAGFVQQTAGHFVRVDSASAYVRDS